MAPGLSNKQSATAEVTILNGNLDSIESVAAPTGLSLEGLRITLESVGLTDLSTDKLSQLYSAFSDFNNNNKNQFNYDSSQNIFIACELECDDVTLQRYISNLETNPQPNPVIEESKTINIGTREKPHELQIGTTLNP